MKFLSVLLLVAAGSLCAGAENDGNFNRGGNGQRGNWGGQRGGNGQRGGGMMQNQVFVEVEIAKKYPAEYAEVEKMREAYEAALSALAAKAGVELPTARDAAYRKLRKADPAAFDAIAEKMKTSPREGFSELMSLAAKHKIQLFGNANWQGGGMKRQRGGAAVSGNVSGRGADRPDLPALRRKYPEKMQEYDRIRKSDPAKARELLLKIIELDKSGKK